jgi:hypothetical protein
VRLANAVAAQDVGRHGHIPRPDGEFLNGDGDAQPTRQVMINLRTSRKRFALLDIAGKRGFD